jgi:RNA polymerase sigma-70 factor (ECF subfamily)
MKKVDYIENQLIESFIKDNDKSGIGILFSTYWPDVYCFIYSKIKYKEVAKDLTQETFMKAFLALKTFKQSEKSKLKSWLLRIANNLVVDYFRQSKKRVEYVLIEKYPFTNYCYSELEVDFDYLRNLELVTVFITDLTFDLLPEQRQVLELRLKQNLSFKDISKIQNVQINTALGRYRYAIMHLKNKIATCANFNYFEDLRY